MAPRVSHDGKRGSRKVGSLVLPPGGGPRRLPRADSPLLTPGELSRVDGSERASRAVRGRSYMRHRFPVRTFQSLPPGRRPPNRSCPTTTTVKTHRPSSFLSTLSSRTPSSIPRFPSRELETVGMRRRVAANGSVGGSDTLASKKGPVPRQVSRSGGICGARILCLEVRLATPSSDSPPTGEVESPRPWVE
jgi:hypothetical protein